MAQKVSLKFDLQIIDEDIDNNGNATVVERFRHEDIWTDGTSDSGQADRNYIVKSGTASSTPTDVDVAGAITRRVHGDTLTMADVALVYFHNKSTTTTIQVGGDAGALALFGAAADYEFVPPGGKIVRWTKISRWAVTASTGDILQIATASGTAEYDLAIVGRSA